MDDPADQTVLAADDGLRILGGYPGANATDVRIDDGTVRLAHDYRDAGSDWVFYWNVGIESDRDRTVDVEFTSGEVVGRWGPAVSDDRREWSWLGGETTPDRERFRHEFAADERAYFAFSFPYVRADFERFWDSLPAGPVERETLVETPGGRPNPVCRIGDPGADDHVVLAARHHACESTASYALEGAVRALLDAPGIDERCVHVVPLVDLDGVQRGDQGKSRLPHDHNRDYAPGNGVLDDVEPIYPSTAALQEYVEGLSGTVHLGLDFHAPYKWGDPHDETFFAGDPSEARPEERRFARAVADETAGTAYGGLAFEADPGFAEPGGRSAPAAFTSFLRRVGASTATTLEVPYLGRRADRVTPAACRALGRAVGRAIPTVW